MNQDPNGVAPVAPVKKSRHPVAGVFHLLFKVAAFVTYMFGSLIPTDVKILPFILCVLFLVFDFWTVKNVTGRLLVGLRWWNEVREDGKSQWVFESLEDRALLSASEVRMFWISTAIAPIAWTVLAISALFPLPSPFNLVRCVLGALLGYANLVGYIRCARQARRKIKNMAVNYVTSAVVGGAIERL
jgi:hypothetical protein